jgi:hypothetical protein
LRRVRQHGSFCIFRSTPAFCRPRVCGRGTV